MRKVSLEPGTEYAILTTQGAPKPNPKTGQTPTREEQDVLAFAYQITSAAHVQAG